MSASPLPANKKAPAFTAGACESWGLVGLSLVVSDQLPTMGTEPDAMRLFCW